MLRNGLIKEQEETFTNYRRDRGKIGTDRDQAVNMNTRYINPDKSQSDARDTYSTSEEIYKKWGVVYDNLRIYFLFSVPTSSR